MNAKTASTETGPTARHDAPQALAMVTSAEALSRVRDMPGLTVAQRRFLLERLRFESDAACARALGLHTVSPANWKAESALFAEEYAALLDSQTAALAAQVQAELERMAGLIPSTIVAMLTAEDDVYDKSGHVVGRAPAWRARKDGLEVLSRWLDRWNGTPAVSQDNESAAQLRRIADTLEAARQQSSRPTASVQDSGPDASIVEGTAEVLPDGPGP